MILASFFVVAFGHPTNSRWLSAVAACLGYALFWKGALEVRRPFWLAALWFGAVQAVQLSWLTSTVYMGSGILVVYAFLVIALGLQFGWMTHLLKQPLTWLRILGAAGFWVWMEWVRLLPFTGFPWNPVGLSLASHPWSIQWASLFGVYGLSFWVILTNLSFLKNPKIFAVMALVPYAFGVLHQTYWSQKNSNIPPLQVALVQTALRNEQKDYDRSQPKEFISPFHQWERILWSLRDTKVSQYDLIVLPEAALPFGNHREVYLKETVQEVWESCFGKTIDFSLVLTNKVSNSFWAQSLANHFGAEVVIGLDSVDSSGKYNAAFHFVPRKESVGRYEKRMLVPVGEYVPLKEWKVVASFLSKEFGIEDSFDVGKGPKVFTGKTGLGVCICSEEIYGELIRGVRKAGAELLVNVTNDSWFPKTQLPNVHFLHGQVRAAENGVGVVRACNTGVTGAIDRFGRVIDVLGVSEETAGVLTVQVIPESHPTAYTFWGDTAILLLSTIFIVCLRKRLPEYIPLN
ncbi:MAG TPA: apolipoprotein N-acyltransferase [Chlamydiales bacterium]